MEHTGAGRQLNGKIHKVQEKHRQELAGLEKEKLDALRKRDAESVKQIKELQRENAQKLEQMAQARESIRVDMARILELREQEEKNARFDQYLWERRKELDQLQEKQSKALEQKIKTMWQTSQL